MNERSTLIILVNQIKSEVMKSTVIGLPEQDEKPLGKIRHGDLTPPERSVRAILGYAKSLEITDTETLGKIEWVLN